jgi:tetratricopeptide (TPR) repeat protein
MKRARILLVRKVLLTLMILTAFFFLFELVFRPRALRHALASGYYSFQLYPSAERIWSGELAEDGDFIPESSIGKVFYKSGNFSEAEDSFSKSVLEDDRIPGTHYDLGNALYRNAKLDEALEEYKAVMLLDPDDQEAKSNYELVLNRQGYNPPPPPDEDSGDDDVKDTEEQSGEEERSSDADTREQYKNILDALDQKELFDRQKRSKSDNPQREERWW